MPVQHTATIMLPIYFLLMMLQFSCSASVLLPNIQITKHNQGAINKMLLKVESLPINHDYPGASCNDDGANCPKSFLRLNESIVIGRGLNDFQRASRIMLSFGMVDGMSWASIVTRTGVKKADLAVGSSLGTLIKCYNTMWTLNPCRISHLSRSGNASPISKLHGFKRVDRIAYSTVSGHLISGEERFRVVLAENDDVIFDIYSFTKGAGGLGKLVMPFIRPIQRAFFRDVTLTMKKLIETTV